MTNVFVVATRTNGTGGFEWFWDEAHADAYLIGEFATAKEFESKGEHFKVAKFMHATELSDADSITNEIDDALDGYENQYGLLPAWATN